MDLNRGITSITYDINQRPRSVVLDSGASTDYIYSADGVKLQTRHRTPTLSPAAGMGVADESTGESVTDYCGPFIYEDGELTRINLENGYLSYRSYSGQKLEVPEYVFYLRDHLGNNRVTMSANGGIYQIDHFYPFGLPMGCSYNSAFQQWRFGGKEFDRTAGLDLYDFEARAYDPSTARFRSSDPQSETFAPFSGYTYCLNRPLMNVDPSGEVTYVRMNESGQYEVYDGKLKDGNDILIQTKNGDIKIGETLTLYSFYNTDTKQWTGIIDPSDNSGINFLNEIYNDTPELVDYAINARKREKYDFKLTNGTGESLPEGESTIYRGMPFGQDSNGTTIYASARDIGNFAAGYVAGVNLLSWDLTRNAFDCYQSIQSHKPTTEGKSSQAAQKAGYNKGVSVGLSKSPKILNSINYSIRCNNITYDILQTLGSVLRSLF